MVLAVSFDGFAPATKLVGVKEVFLAEHGKRLLISAANLEKNVLLTCEYERSYEEAEAELEKAGLKVLKGQWSTGVGPTDHGLSTEAYVAAVSYHSRESIPGLWMDAFPTQPSPQIVLRAMYDEFTANDEIGDVCYEDFLKLAKPNVVILSPGEIETFLRQKEEC